MLTTDVKESIRHKAVVHGACLGRVEIRNFKHMRWFWHYSVLLTPEFMPMIESLGYTLLGWAKNPIHNLSWSGADNPSYKNLALLLLSY